MKLSVLMKKQLDWNRIFNSFSSFNENGVKEQKDGFIGMLFHISGASLLENMLPGKGVIKAGDGVIFAVKKQLEWYRIFISSTFFK